MEKDKKNPVTPLKRELRGLYRGDKHSDTMGEILETLIKETCDHLSDDVANHLIDQSIVHYNDFCLVHFARTVAVKGKKRGQKEKKRLPSKPTKSPLLTSDEFSSLMKIPVETFKPLYDDKSFKKKIISGASYASMLEELRGHYKTITEFLQDFGKITTKRLNFIRKDIESPSLRKADVDQVKLSKSLTNDKKGSARFAQLLMLFRNNEIKTFIRNTLEVGENFNMIGLTETNMESIETALHINKYGEGGLHKKGNSEVKASKSPNKKKSTKSSDKDDKEKEKLIIDWSLDWDNEDINAFALAQVTTNKCKLKTSALKSMLRERTDIEGVIDQLLVEEEDDGVNELKLTIHHAILAKIIRSMPVSTRKDDLEYVINSLNQYAHDLARNGAKNFEDSLNKWCPKDLPKMLNESQYSQLQNFFNSVYA